MLLSLIRWLIIAAFGVLFTLPLKIIFTNLTVLVEVMLIHPGVHFIKVKRRHLKHQIMAFKCQKWRLTFMKFHKTVLAFKTPKCGVCITNIGV